MSASMVTRPEGQTLPRHVEAVARVAVERGNVPNELRDDTSGPLRHLLEQAAGGTVLDNLDWLLVLQALDEAIERAVRATASKVTRCDTCTQPLRWVHTVKGKRMPIDPLPHAMGNVVFANSGSSRSVVEVLPRTDLPVTGRPAYRPHMSTCPFASHYARPARIAPRCVVCGLAMNADYVAVSGDNTHPCCSDVGRIER